MYYNSVIAHRFIDTLLLENYYLPQIHTNNCFEIITTLKRVI